jgi:flagellar protein FliS
MPNSTTPGHAASAYLEQDIRTADPVTLVSRVFEIAVVHVARARTALAARQMAAKGIAVQKVAHCLSLLQASLDAERGGEVAANMDRVYAYLLRRLGEGHRRNDDAAFAEIATHLSELGAAWREAAARRLATPPPAEAAATR